MRVGNAIDGICWEQSPAGNDVCLQVDASENFVFDSDINFIDISTNPIDGTETSDPSNPTLTHGTIWIDSTLPGSRPMFKSDSRAEFPMTGHIPPYKWGQFIPVSATASGVGLLAAATLVGTETYTYDTTDSSSAISSASGTVNANNAGIHTVAANRNVYRGDQNAYAYVKWEASEVTTNRIFLGFSSSATLLPNNADTILSTLHGAGLCIRTTDTVYQFCHNDGTGATVFDSLTTTEDTDVHTFEVFSYDEGATWCGVLDGGTPVCATTDIPTTTQRMNFQATSETAGTSGTTFIYYNVYTRSDK